jgi:hypothetical protein
VLNGTFLATMSGLTANLDYMLNVYQNVAAAALGPGRMMRVHSVALQALNWGATNGATDQVYAVYLAFGANAISAAVTAETTTAKIYRHLPLGFIRIAGNAIVGAAYSPAIDVKIDPPIYINPGEWVGVHIKPVVYTTVASQTMLYTLAINAGWDL